MARAQTFHAIGKRKSSVARVYLKSGSTTEWLINDKPATQYFPEVYQNVLGHPFKVLELQDKFSLVVSVRGGGLSSQAQACAHGIAKALTLVSEEYRPSLKKARLLTRDSRVVERKKYGHKKARKSFQFSKR
jgi:small subunit ribosomal protein S9